MPIPDKIAAAKKIDALLRGVVTHGGLHLKYRITVDPPLAQERDWERPEILVELSGPDSPLVLERGGELLRAIETLAIEMLRLPGNEHEKVIFDCMNQRAMRLEELRLAAGVAAERVRKTNHAIRICAYVLARAPHCALSVARSRRPAHREPGRRRATMPGGLPEELQAR